MPAFAKNWRCVRDNVTGLIWEKKPAGDGVQGNQGLHDADDRFTWYSTDTGNNGGLEGIPDGTDNRACHGYQKDVATTFCNTEAYVNRVNGLVRGERLADADGQGIGAAGRSEHTLPGSHPGHRIF